MGNCFFMYSKHFAHLPLFKCVYCKKRCVSPIKFSRIKHKSFQNITYQLINNGLHHLLTMDIFEGGSLLSTFADSFDTVFCRSLLHYQNFLKWWNHTITLECSTAKLLLDLELHFQMWPKLFKMTKISVGQSLRCWINL